MKTSNTHSRTATGAFTMVEILISLTICVLVMAMALSTYLFGLRTMYKDAQRLATNASLRSFMAQISKETLDASYFYLFPYYTALDGSVDLDPGTDNTYDYAAMNLVDYADDDYDKWLAHGDCLVLVTKSSLYRSTDIRQIRIYYRMTKNQRTTTNMCLNQEAQLRYYETSDWGEGTSTTSNGHTDLTTELNQINLNSSTLAAPYAGSRMLNARSKGRAVPSPFTGYTAGDLYPMFSSESPSENPSNGFISINIEFINGTTTNNMLSSSSFNYTISPRR